MDKISNNCRKAGTRLRLFELRNIIWKAENAGFFFFTFLTMFPADVFPSFDRTIVNHKVGPLIYDGRITYVRINRQTFREALRSKNLTNARLKIRQTSDDPLM